MAKRPDNPFQFDLEHALGQMRVPGFDVEGMLASQRKNMEALAQANRLAMEGIQALFHRQAEILRQTVEESATAARQLVDAGTPQENAIRQTERLKEAFERALANSRELTEIVSKSNSEAIGLLNKRFAAILDEIRDGLSKTK